MTKTKRNPSFSARVKEFLTEKTLEELGDNPNHRVKMKDHCQSAFFAGVLQFGARKTPDGSRRYSPDHPALADLLKERIHIVSGEDPREKGTDLFLSEESYLLLRERCAETTFACPQCAAHFLRGAFLGCGTVQDPAKGYHAAFLCRDGGEERLSELFETLDRRPGRQRRGGSVSLYFKNSTAIEDLLSLMGAEKFSLMLMNQKIEKSIWNDVNRRQNFDGANLRRSVDRTQSVLEAIRYLKKERAYDALPENLKAASNLILTFPDASLRELCEKSEEPLTKSGLDHRLSRIRALAEERKRKNGRT